MRIKYNHMANKALFLIVWYAATTFMFPISCVAGDSKVAVGGGSSLADVVFQRHPNHQYGFDDVSGQEDKTYYMSLERRQINDEFCGFTTLKNEKKIEINMYCNLLDFHYLLNNNQVPTTIFNYGGEFKVWKSTDEYNENNGCVDVQIKNQNKSCTKLFVDAYDRKTPESVKLNSGVHSSRIRLSFFQGNGRPGWSGNIENGVPDRFFAHCSASVSQKFV